MNLGSMCCHLVLDVEYLITKNDPHKVLTPIDQPQASHYILPSMLFAMMWCKSKNKSEEKLLMLMKG